MLDVQVPGCSSKGGAPAGCPPPACAQHTRVRCMVAALAWMCGSCCSLLPLPVMGSAGSHSWAVWLRGGLLIAAALL